LTRSERKELDGLWKERVKERAGYKCEKCGSIKTLQCHHIIPRTCFTLKYDITNGVTLCLHCHLFWAHKDAIGFAEWIKGKRDVPTLELKRHNQTKNDYNLIKLYLEGI
jgi:5-methylcytosine-specific restriction endonuclease McrA